MGPSWVQNLRRKMGGQPRGDHLPFPPRVAEISNYNFPIRPFANRRVWTHGIPHIAASTTAPPARKGVLGVGYPEGGPPKEMTEAQEIIAAQAQVAGQSWRKVIR